jgi:hypothetical protein
LNDIITDKLEKLNLSYPEVSKEQREALQMAREELMSEKD